MTGIINRVQGACCEVGTCFLTAQFTEFVRVVPGDPNRRNERHASDIVVCWKHEAEFQHNGLVGVVTAYGDTIAQSA
jgi:hypothetical protein